MSRASLALAAVLLLGSGCANKKLAQNVNSIQALTVTDTVWQRQANVSFGQLAIPEDGTGAVEAAANVSLAIFEAEMATRLAEIVEADNLAMNTSRAAGQRLDKRGPFPTKEEDRGFKLDLALQDWGLRADTNEPAAAWTTLHAQLYEPSGERIWRTSVTCTSPLAPDTVVDGVTQVAVSIGTIRGTPDEEITKAYRELARVCARDVVDAFGRSVDKAKQKAAKKGW